MSIWTRRLGLVLEWTCHGIPWITCVLLWLVLLLCSNMHEANVQSLYDVVWNWKDRLSYRSGFEVNSNISKLLSLLIALLLDVVLVGLIKFIFRRQRPKEDNHSDMRLTVGVDAWSFPSGHASRSTMLFFLISYLWLSSSNIRIMCLFLLWNIIVCYSRYAMRRHHLTDILAGCVLGCAEYYLITLINW
ncbi:unnamed protein product [Heterobilharzia americana]|nr:unnamed protein product [Heterobilharzia americana]CAH8656895.1 unnamed protein product [Heterobilharzia americana]